MKAGSVGWRRCDGGGGEHLGNYNIAQTVVDTGEPVVAAWRKEQPSAPPWAEGQS